MASTIGDATSTSVAIAPKDLSSSDGSPSSADPDSRDRLWFRWSQGAQIIAEGPASAGYDKIVWHIPDKEGAYSVRVDFYPGPPPGSTYSIPSPWHQTISFIAKSPVPDQFKDPFSVPSRFFSLFTFDGPIADSALNASGRSVVLTGSPSLIAIADGYGERFNSTDGFVMSGLGFYPGAHDGKFSILLRFSPEGSSGILLSLPVAGGGRLAIGLDGGSLWLECPGSATSRKLYPDITPGKGFHDLMVSFLPDKAGTTVVWSFDTALRVRMSVPAFDVRFDKLVMGGDSSATAVWDAIGICYDNIEGSPSFFASSLYRQKGDRLMVASGFESGLGRDLIAKGRTGIQPFGIALYAGSELDGSTELLTRAGLEVSIGIRAGSLRFALDRPDGSPFLSISGNGEVRDGAGALLLVIPENAQRFGLTLIGRDKVVEIRGSDQGASKEIKLQLPPRLRYSIIGISNTNIETFAMASSADA